jgi:hypothetical protein
MRLRRPGAAAACLCSFVFALVACVPASEKRPPAGAGGFAIEPSAAARGEPFVTTDGWTIMIDKLIVRATINVTPAPFVNNTNWGSEDYHLFDGSKQARIFLPGIPVGAFLVRADPYSEYLVAGRPAGGLLANSYHTELDVVGVGPADVARFAELSDEGLNTDSTPTYGASPSVVLALRGRRGDQQISVSVAEGSTGSYVHSLDQGDAPRIDIVANELVLATLHVTPELIFGPDFGFTPLVAADRNGDAHITGDELRATPAAQRGSSPQEENPSPSTGGFYAATLLDALASRIQANLLKASPLGK